MKKVLIVLLLLPLVCLAQNKKNKLYPHAILSGGVQGGQKFTAAALQLSGGVNVGHWFTGVGVGLDYYRFNTIPVFADLRYNFGPKGIVYAYVHPGYHFLQPTQKQLESIWAQKIELKAGFFGEGGVGYRLNAGKYHHIGLSIGYRYRKMTHSRYLWSPWSWWPAPTDAEPAKDRYSFTTIVTKLTWDIGK